MQQTIGCSHELCECTITAGMESQAYCSDACRELAEDSRIEGEVCPCGHPPCDTAP